MSDKTPNRKLACLPNTQILWKYGSIFSQLWLLYPVLRYFDTTGTSHLIPFLWAFSFIPMTWTSTLSCPIQCSLMNPKSPPACVSCMCQMNVFKMYCIVFHPKSGSPYLVSSQLIQARKRGMICLSCFRTSNGSSSPITPKSFRNMSLPSLFFCGCFCSYRHLPGLLWNNLIDYFPIFYYSNSSSCCSCL